MATLRVKFIVVYHKNVSLMLQKHNDHQTNFNMDVIGEKQKVANGQKDSSSGLQINLKKEKGGSLKNVSILDDHFSINMKLYRSC